MVLNVLRSRKFAKKAFLGLIIVIIPVFVLWGMGSISKKGGAIGTIGGQKIFADTLAESLEGVKIQVLLTYFQDQETLGNIFKNTSLINTMAWERLIFLNAAHKKRIKVPDRTVLSFLVSHPLFQRSGMFDRQIYEYILRNNLSMDARRFEELLRENLTVRTLRQEILKDVEVKDDEVLAYFKEGNDKATLSYFLLDKAKFAGEVTTSPEEVENYYKSNLAEFQAPAKINVEYVELGFDTAETKDASLKTMDSFLLDAKKSPDTFKETAKKFDMTAAETGAFSWIDVIPGVVYSKEIHDELFVLNTGEISRVLVSSPDKGKAYVFHKLADIPSKQMSLDEVQQKIVLILKDAKAAKVAMEKAESLYKKIQSGEFTLQAAAESSGETLSTTEPRSGSGDIEAVGPAHDIVTRSLKAGAGQILEPVQSPKGPVIAKVESITPADTKTFDEQKKTLRENLLSRKQMSEIDRWLRENSPPAVLKKDLGKISTIRD